MRRLIVSVLILSLSVIPTHAQEPVDTSRALDILWDQAHRQPEDFSMVCMPLVNPADLIQYNADSPFPLASVSKLVIFIEYARQVEAGLLTLDEMVRLNDLNLYDLPRSNSDAHEHFLDLYGSDTLAISLWDIASVGMIQYSSNAAADFLLDRLGPTDWDSLYRTLQVSHTSPPHSMSAIALLMSNHETGRISPSRIPTLSIAQGEALLDQYVQDAEWHKAEVDYRADQLRLFPSWEVQAAILDQLTATGTTSDFLALMAAIYETDSPLSPRVRQLTRDALRWKNNAYVDAMYLEYGSKLGFYSGGVIALVAYGHPYAGDPVISAAFFQNVPRQVYTQMLRRDSIGEFAHWMNLNACGGLLNGVLADLPGVH